MTLCINKLASASNKPTVIT